jgi:hypothetical protein
LNTYVDLADQIAAVVQPSRQHRCADGAAQIPAIMFSWYSAIHVKMVTALMVCIFTSIFVLLGATTDTVP